MQVSDVRLALADDAPAAVANVAALAPAALAAARPCGAVCTAYSPPTRPGVRGKASTFKNIKSVALSLLFEPLLPNHGGKLIAVDPQ